MCKGKGLPGPANMTEQTNTFRSTNKYHGKLTSVNLVFHQCCNNGQYPQR